MTQRSFSTRGLLSLALARRGLAPTCIVHEDDMFEPRVSMFGALKAFLASLFGLPRIAS
jgi:hypothetical protein